MERRRVEAFLRSRRRRRPALFQGAETGARWRSYWCTSAQGGRPPRGSRPCARARAGQTGADARLHPFPPPRPPSEQHLLVETTIVGRVTLSFTQSPLPLSFSLNILSHHRRPGASCALNVQTPASNRPRHTTQKAAATPLPPISSSPDPLVRPPEDLCSKSVGDCVYYLFLLRQTEKSE